MIYAHAEVGRNINVAMADKYDNIKMKNIDFNINQGICHLLNELLEELMKKN